MDYVLAILRRPRTRPALTPEQRKQRKLYRWMRKQDQLDAMDCPPPVWMQDPYPRSLHPSLPRRPPGCP